MSVALGVAVTCVLLSVFYVQYRWLADRIVSASSAEYVQLAESHFENTSRLRLDNAAALVLKASADKVVSDINLALDTILIDSEPLTGVMYVDPAGQIFKAGSYPDLPPKTEVTWLAEYLLITRTLSRDGNSIGTLSGAFDLSALYAESAQFTREITSTEVESRRVSYLWAGAGTLIALLLLGGVVWLVVRGHNKRIRLLRAQAEKLRDSDFSAPLLEA